MRAIFFTLVFIDIAIYIWGSYGGNTHSAADSKPKFSRVSSDVSRLNMLGELDSNNLKAVPSPVERPDRVARSAQGKEAVSSINNKPLSSVFRNVARKDLCEMVGAFRNRKQADDFIQRLKAIDIRSELKELELPAGPGYWVYLSPESNRRQALRRLSELQAKGIDSYVIPKGDLANGISLGMFSQRNLADARLKEMNTIGLQPKLEIIERTYRELWVMLGKREDQKMSEITWQRLLDENNLLERRQNFCLGVAS